MTENNNQNISLNKLIDLYTKRKMSKYPSYREKEMDDEINDIYSGLLNSEKQAFIQYRDSLDEDIEHNPKHYFTLRLSETTKSTTYARIMYYFMLSLVAKKNDSLNIVSRTFSVEDIRLHPIIIGSSGSGKNVNESFIKSVFNSYNEKIRKFVEDEYKNKTKKLENDFSKRVKDLDHNDYRYEDATNELKKEIKKMKNEMMGNYIELTSSIANLTSDGLLGGYDKNGIEKPGLFEDKKYSCIVIHEAGDMFYDDKFNQFKKGTLKNFCQAHDPIGRNPVMKTTMSGNREITGIDDSLYMTSFPPDIVSEEFIKGGMLRRSIIYNISKTTKEVIEQCKTWNDTLIGTGNISYTKTEEKLISSMIDLLLKIKRNERTIEISADAIREINRIFDNASSLISDSENEICKVLRIAINSHITKLSVLSAIDRIFSQDDNDFVVGSSDVREIEDLVYEIMENYIDFCLKEKKENIQLRRESIEFIIKKAIDSNKKSRKKVTADEIMNNIFEPMIKELVSSKYIETYMKKHKEND